jgi:hypothetical protein
MSFGCDALWFSVVIQCDHYGVFSTFSHHVLSGSAVGPLKLLRFFLCVLWTMKKVIQWMFNVIWV